MKPGDKQCASRQDVNFCVQSHHRRLSLDGRSTNRLLRLPAFVALGAVLLVSRSQPFRELTLADVFASDFAVDS
jgi:hypothetical protein